MGQQFGVIGLEVMGRNLALNVEGKGFSVAVYNRTTAKTERFMKEHAQGLKIKAAATIEQFVELLERPRRILLMVKAGRAVDAVIGQLKPHLEPGDIVIDGGNSHFPDTDRREAELAPTGIKFFGMGISGGEEGARWGPSLMPGGDRETYQHLEPILTQIAAQADGEACVTYVGEKSAGHFVKMVHNGIEYGDMQLIAESYDLLRHGLGRSNEQMAEIFSEWNRGELKSYLIEISAGIVNFPDDQGGGGPLVEQILDKAGQKGTGKWTSIAALELGVPIPTITAAVDGRILSSHKEIRARVEKAYARSAARAEGETKIRVEQLRSALYASKICSYAQGFHLLQAASREYGYGLNFSECARIWKGGCIIRAVFLDRIRHAFERSPELPSLLLDEDFKKELLAREEDWRETVRLAARLGLPLPAISTSLAYFDGLRRARGPANLIQAQRDFFGAHTYQRLDREGTFHTQWSKASS